MRFQKLLLLRWFVVATPIVVQSQPNYTISVTAIPNTGGTVSGGGTFVTGTAHAVTATANNGYTFGCWTQNGKVASVSASYSFTLSSNINLVANFTGGGIISYQTLNDPLAGSISSYGTYVQGVSGGNIVGYYIDNYGVCHGFLYNGSSYNTLDAPNAATHYYNGTTPTYIGTLAQGTDDGNIVGYYSDTNGYTHGFLYTNGVFTTLNATNGAVSTCALGIFGGNIVGSYSVRGGNGLRACLKSHE